MKKHPYLWSLLAFLCLTTILLQIAEGRVPINELTTIRLTDTTVTAFDARNHQVQNGSHSTHIVWEEHITYPFDPDSALFYSQLPQNSRYQLQMGEGEVGIFRLELDSTEQAHIIWEEDTLNGEYSDLFYWTATLSQPILLSDHGQSTGNVGNKLLLEFDEDDIPHVVWAEANSSYTFDPVIFYWTPNKGTKKISSEKHEPGFNFFATDVLALQVQNGVTHVVWQGVEPSVPIGPIYWNSETEESYALVEGIQSVGTFFDHFFLNSDGKFYILWSNVPDGSSSTPLEYWLWDFEEEQNVLIGTSFDFLNSRFIADQEGYAYIHHFENEKLWHLGTDEQIDLPYGADAGWANFFKGSDDLFHFVWTEDDPNWPGHQYDLFYWRSDMLEPLNVTDHRWPAADASRVQVLIDNHDVAQIIWNEGDFISYFNSQASTTTILTNTEDEVVVAHPDFTPRPSHEGNVVLGTYFAAQNGRSYVLLQSTRTETERPYYVWDSMTNVYYEVTAVYGTTKPTNEAMIWIDSNDQPHVAWVDDAAIDESGTNLFHWTPANGSQDISLNTAPNRFIDEKVWHNVTAVADELGQVYLVWLEGDSESYNDLFATFTLTELVHQTYIPIILK